MSQSDWKDSKKGTYIFSQDWKDEKQKLLSQSVCECLDLLLSLKERIDGHADPYFEEDIKKRKKDIADGKVDHRGYDSLIFRFPRTCGDSFKNEVHIQLRLYERAYKWREISRGDVKEPEGFVRFFPIVRCMAQSTGYNAEDLASFSRSLIEVSELCLSIEEKLRGTFRELGNRPEDPIKEKRKEIEFEERYYAQSEIRNWVREKNHKTTTSAILRRFCLTTVKCCPEAANPDSDDSAVLEALSHVHSFRLDGKERREMNLMSPSLIHVTHKRGDKSQIEFTKEAIGCVLRWRKDQRGQWSGGHPLPMSEVQMES